MGSSPSAAEKREEDEMKKFLRPGVHLNDIKNLKKAFKLLDKDNDGLILYDIDKIEDCSFLI